MLKIWPDKICKFTVDFSIDKSWMKKCFNATTFNSQHCSSRLRQAQPDTLRFSDVFNVCHPEFIEGLLNRIPNVQWLQDSWKAAESLGRNSVC